MARIHRNQGYNGEEGAAAASTAAAEPYDTNPMPVAHREIEIEIDDVDVGVERSSMNNPDESTWASGPNPPAAVTAPTAAAAAAAIKAGDGQQQQDAGDDASSHSSEGSLAELRQELSSTRLPMPRFQLRRQPSGAWIGAAKPFCLGRFCSDPVNHHHHPTTRQCPRRASTCGS